MLSAHSREGSLCHVGDQMMQYLLIKSWLFISLTIRITPWGGIEQQPSGRKFFFMKLQVLHEWQLFHRF